VHLHSGKHVAHALLDKASHSRFLRLERLRTAQYAIKCFHEHEMSIRSYIGRRTLALHYLCRLCRILRACVFARFRAAVLREFFRVATVKFAGTIVEVFSAGISINGKRDFFGFKMISIRCLLAFSFHEFIPTVMPYNYGLYKHVLFAA
jgi:hypothetical protein